MHFIPKFLITYCAWPSLLILGLGISAYGFHVGHPMLCFNVAYALCAALIYGLEYAFPFEKEWQKPDGQLVANLGHTLTSKGMVLAIVVFSSVIGLTGILAPWWGKGLGFWPSHWPMVAQIALGVTAAEFGLYWAHRLSHQYYSLWRMHAVHHSVVKLWVMNTGSFHFLDSIFKIASAMAVLFVFGAPVVVVQWLSIVTAFIGILTHCNIDVKTGFLSWIFNTPNLHRWHHSRDLREGNKNYGENVVLWDLLFGTWYNPARRPPANIGIKETMPARFRDQFLYPFVRRSYR